MTTERIGDEGIGCSGFQELASGLMDGELSESETLFLRRHLADCSRCRDFLHFGYHVRNWVRAAEGARDEAVPSAGFAASARRAAR